ncbi:hypothetical protein G9Q38_01645 [Pusillimonas sp. DMV24BSW_D]|uniref:PepSY-associated TM helix domain-containing protein n=1 Tax=Neopusillimonas aestuarii TaxID=2716226 RepID=UPI00140C168A|nr:PepSY-associated TM helix domain-containing protein [Pusillimonas sp. DMV24BSW_D]QIM47970.1 hypothetical protein G9Q38_01645 [Pusillimonas sp. DMV24BSW_D]
MAASFLSRPRAFWLKQLHQWHWISSALCLAGLLLFSITGITLNNASWFGGQIETRQEQLTVPADITQSLNNLVRQSTEALPYVAPLPKQVEQWLDQALHIRIGSRPAEFSETEIYLSLPEPGGDAWLALDLTSGDLEYERTQRGWVAYLNDLHKGRHTGTAWKWFIDLFAVASLIFATTGLFLLKLHGKHRPLTWPITGVGLLIPILLMLLLVH